MYNSGYDKSSSIRPQELDFPPYGQPGMGHVPPRHHPQMQQPMPPQPMHTTNTNTTLVIQQQQQPQLVIQHPRDWSNGICSCCDDCGVCKFVNLYLCNQKAIRGIASPNIHSNIVRCIRFILVFGKIKPMFVCWFMRNVNVEWSK